MLIRLFLRSSAFNHSNLSNKERKIKTENGMLEKQISVFPFVKYNQIECNSRTELYS